MRVDFKKFFSSTVLEDAVFSDEQPEDLKKVIPALEDGWGSYGEFKLVGNGEVTNENCGRYSHKKGCLRVENHNKVIFDKDGNSVNCKGKGYVKIFHNWCDKPSCPICFKHGWAVREAHNIEARLTENGKYGKLSGKWGLVEHLFCSVPVRDYGLSYKTLRKKVVKILLRLGVIGGVKIFHGFRYNKRKCYWYWSPHFHVLGFIKGGYGRCRHCKGADCYACGGFDGKTYKLYHENGWIVGVLGKRKTVYGTAWYQLHHATIRTNVKRPHACTWFGVCSYRRLKVTVEKHKHLCPICNEELYKVYYHGFERIVTDRKAFGFVPYLFVDVFASDGSKMWVEGG